MNINDFTQKPVQGRVYAKNEVPAFVITTHNTLLATLKIGNEVIFKGSYAADFNDQITIDFRGLYDHYLKTLIPTTGSNEITHTQYLQQFTAVFDVLIGEDTAGEPATISWKVANAKLKSDLSYDEWSEINFLTNQPMEKTTNYEAPEWLTWRDGGTSCELIARFYRKNGTSLDVTVRAASNEGVFSANVRYSRLIHMANVLPSSLLGYYDLILVNAKDEEVACQRYIYEERTGREKYFLFVNALGGIDTLICPGENVLQPDITHNIGRFGRQYLALDDTDDMRKWMQQIGMVPTRQRNWIYELLSTKQGAEKYDPETMKYLEIVVDSSDIVMSDFGQLAGSSFSYILNETENIVADTERPDRSLHQSVAEQAEELHDDTTKVFVTFSHGVTDPVVIPADVLYVLFDWDESQKVETVYYFVNGSKEGEFTPGEDESPVQINIKEGVSVHFETEGPLEYLELRYYPINNV